MKSRTRIGLTLAFCVSLGVHGMAYASLASARRSAPIRDFVSEVSFEVKALPPPPPPPPEAPTLLPEPAPAKSRESSPTIKPSAPPPLAAPNPARPAAAPAAAVLDLSGVTLTNDTGVGFAVPVGDGSALHGAIGVSRVAAEAVRPSAVVAAAPQKPALVAARDLSEHPVPPALGNLLRANYPEEARQRGLRGSASVRARIDPDGVVRVSRLVSESAAGFGAACRRTVLGSHWSAPRDKNGGAVATEIVYTCHFEVDR